jgi:hypothetical protein
MTMKGPGVSQKYYKIIIKMDNLIPSKVLVLSHMVY